MAINAEMNTILVNDIFDELKDENQTLFRDLCFEKSLNSILEKIKTISMILKNNCICSENIEVFRQLNDLEIDYKLLKSKRNDHQRSCSDSAPLYQRLTNVFNGPQRTDTSKSIEVVIPDQMVTTGTSNPLTDPNDIHSVSHQLVPTFNCDKCDKRFDSAIDLEVHINCMHRIDGNGRMVSKPGFRPITDFLRSYRKPSKSNTSEPIDTNVNRSDANNEKISHFIPITELLKPTNSTEKSSAPKFGLPTPNQKVRKPISKSDRSYPCPQCTEELKTSKDFTKHLRTFHPEYRPFECAINGCPLTYTTKHHLREHQMKKHKTPKSKIVLINSELALDENNTDGVCEQKPCKSADVKVNVKIEPEEKDLSNIKMEVISDSEDESKLKALIPKETSVTALTPNESNSFVSDIPTALLTDNPRFFCHLCGFNTMDKNLFEKHLNTHSNKFKCNICNKEYSRKWDLKQHKKRVHKTFTAVTAKKIHKSITKNVSKESNIANTNSHSEVKPFKCNFNGCKYSCERRDLLNRHIKRMHLMFSVPKQSQPRWVCEFPNCNLRFITRDKLYKHRSTAHINRFSCRWTGCQFQTNTFAKLNEHKRIENHIKPEQI